VRAPARDGLPILVLHDADALGCLWVARMRAAFPGARVVDAGLRPVTAKLGATAVRLRGRSQSGNLDGTWAVLLTIGGPEAFEARLFVSGTEIVGRKEPAAPGPDGGPSDGVRVAFDNVPKDFFAPVLELTSGGDKVRIRLRPPSLL